MRRLGLLLLCLISAAPGRAGHFSLYPDRSDRDRVAELDDLEPWPHRLAFGHWHPYGLPGVRLEALEGSGTWGGWRCRLGATQEDWGVLQSWRWRAALLRVGDGPLRLGLEGSRERLLSGSGGGKAASALELLAVLSGPAVLMLRLDLAEWTEGPARPERSPALLGLSYPHGGWTLRGWRGASGEGLALAHRLGPLEIELQAQQPGWQGLTLRYRRARWALVVEERVHPWLGASHGFRILFR